MKHMTAFPFAFFFGAFVVTACGGSEQPAGVDDSNATPTKDAGGQCVTSCTSDSECASSCPVLEGATQCCDLASKSCFRSKTAACPKITPDAGPTVPQY